MAQFQTVQIPKRIQLVTQPGYRSSNLTTDAQLINCFAEKDLDDGEYWITKRPGFGDQILMPAGSGVNPARGLYKFQGFSGGTNAYIFLVVNNARLSRIDSAAATTTLIGNIANAQAQYTFETIRTSPNYTAVLMDGNNAYTTDGTTITDMNTFANFPTGLVRGWAYLDGTLYVMTANNRIFGSGPALDNPTVWDPLNVIIARNGSDQSVALAKHKEYVMALKESSTEFFYNAGNPTGSPLSSLRGSKIPYGCANAYTVQTIDLENMWMSQTENGQYQIVRLTNLQPRVVSTPAVERILRTFSGYTGTGNALLVNSFQLKVGGHRFYGISATFSNFGYTNRNITLVYDLDQNIWAWWTEAGSENRWPVATAVGLTTGGQMLMQHWSTGGIHFIAEDYRFPQDAGTVPTVEIYTPDHDFGTQRTKQLGAMFYRGDQIPGGTLRMRWSDDNYQSWSSFREIDLGAKRPMVTDCGSFYKRVWNLQYNTPTYLRLKTFDLQLDIGQN